MKLNNRKLAKNLSSEEFPVKGMHRFFVNENLTQQRKKLLWATRQRANENQFKYVWTNNGNIFVRKNDDAALISIMNETDLYKLLSQQCSTASN